LKGQIPTNAKWYSKQNVEELFPDIHQNKNLLEKEPCKMGTDDPKRIFKVTKLLKYYNIPIPKLGHATTKMTKQSFLLQIINVEIIHNMRFKLIQLSILNKNVNATALTV